MVRDWAELPPDATLTMRVPVEYASFHAAVCESPIATIWMLTLLSVLCRGHTSMFVNIRFSSRTSHLHFSQLTGEDSYQIATMGVRVTRVELVSDGPPPEEASECAVSPVCTSGSG